ncbi:hypothetical protein [Agromyces ramosus]|uniref:Uncharacterized protein n=1 Tax=Agromyces ramosus TaxID=33879 RepID=A0ABU0R8P2_9MICO|nr:hypothetical protein [Agromyces ramosus]MDQ0894435.1 hypothetical protein [Agromyces ramosus]
MIVPVENVATATDAEIIAAYLELGYDEAEAQANLIVLRNPSDRFLVD